MLDLFELNKLLNLYNLRIAEQNDKYYMIDYNSNSIHPLVLENGCYNYSFNLNGLPYTIHFNESTFIVNRVNEKIKINNNGFTYVDKNENDNRAYVNVAENFLTFYSKSESYQASINTRNIDDQFIYLKAEEIFKDKDIQKRQLTIQMASRTALANLYNQIFTKDGFPASMSNQVEEVYNLDGAIELELGKYPTPQVLLNKINNLMPDIIPYLLDINPNLGRIIKKEKDLKKR